MNPKRPSIFQPRPGQTYSKAAVDRAGRNLVRFRQQYSDAGSPEEIGVNAEDLVDWVRAVEWWRALHSRPLSTVANGLRYHVAAEGALLDGRVGVTQRLKRLPTVIDKLEREPKMKLSRMGDIGGVRARLPDLGSVDRVKRRLLKTWRTIESPYRDYIWGPPGPQESGYRGVHMYVRKGGVRIEVQLRTSHQDDWANMVERVSRESKIDYKSGKGEQSQLELFKLVADAMAYLDRGETVPTELVAAIVAARGNRFP